MSKIVQAYNSEKVQSKFRVIIPLILMICCPMIVFLFCYTNLELQGSLLALGKDVASHGFFHVVYKIFSKIFFGSLTAWKILLIFSSFQLTLMKVVPGDVFYGPMTENGNTPTYKSNGFRCFLITITTFCFCSFNLQLFSPTILYDHFPELLGALNFFSLFFCLFLWIKGRLFPSSNDSGSNGSIIFDYYWGTELYPRILGWDVKVFTNCRFGMMSWPLIIISFAAKQSELYGLSNSMLVALLLQLIYISKFFYWETGYLRSLDIMHDRAGFYLCWGCCVWVPGIYTSPTLYLVNHPNQLNELVAWGILLFGSLSILCNYLADRQRQLVRETKGDCTVWGKKPMIAEVSYKTSQGVETKSLLLASGWWGISRHFHYIPEVLGAFFWSLPALFDNFLPYFYVVYLSCLLLERAFRDDRRCSKKYGAGWEKYCELVPYKIVPFIL